MVSPPLSKFAIQVEPKAQGRRPRGHSAAKGSVDASAVSDESLPRGQHERVDTAVPEVERSVSDESLPQEQHARVNGVVSEAQRLVSNESPPPEKDEHSVNKKIESMCRLRLK